MTVLSSGAAQKRSSAPRLCRVALLVGSDTLIDYALPAGVALIAVIEDLIPCINTVLRGRDVAELKDTATYQLCRADARPLDSQKSLDEAGVIDGDTLWLLPTDRTERFEPVIEEVSTALARSARAQFDRVDETTARRVAMGLCIILVAWAEIILAHLWWHSGGWIPATVSAGLAVVLVSLAWLSARSLHEQRRKASDAFGWAAVIAAASGAAMTVPGPPGGWHCVAAIGVLLAGATTITVLTQRYVMTLSAMTVMLSSAAAVAAIGASSWELRPEQIAATALAVMLGLVTFATNIAIVGSGVPSPWFPSITNRGVFETLPDKPRDIVYPVEPTGAVTGEQVTRWARRANHIVTGLVAGCAVVTVAAARYAVVVDQPGGWRFAVFTLAICLVFVLRARSFVDRYQAAILVVGAVLGVAMVIGRYAAASNPPSLTATLVAVAATAGLIFAGLLAALVIPSTPVIAPINRAVEVTEYALLIFVIPWLLWLLNILSLARNAVHGA